MNRGTLKWLSRCAAISIGGGKFKPGDPGIVVDIIEQHSV